MREEFSSQKAGGEVHSVVQPPFWGPVKVIIPDDCALVVRWSTVIHEVLAADDVTEPAFCHSSHGFDLKKAKLSLAQSDSVADERQALRSLLASPDMASANEEKNEHAATKATKDALANVHNASHAFFRGMLEAERRHRSFVVQQCGQNLTLERPGLLTRYFSMIMLQNQMTARGRPTFAETLAKRKCIFDWLVVGISLSMVVKYGPKIVFIFCYLFEDHFNVGKVGRGTRTRFDKAVEGVVLHTISSMFLFTMQMSLCTVFLVFWRGGHFVMAHIPCSAYMVFFVSMVAITVANELDKVYGWTSRFCTARLTVLFWSIWGGWMLVITVPLAGTCVYSMQYLHVVRACGWLNAEDIIFSPRFGEAATLACNACVWFVILAVIEQVVHIALEMHEANQTVPKVAVYAFPQYQKISVGK